MSAVERLTVDAIARVLDDPDAVWMPPGLRFEVGQRVQIRISAECQVVPSGGIAEYEGVEGHFFEECGLIGEVHRILDDAHPLARQGHRFFVRFDSVRLIAGWWCHGGSYAAAELVPLTDADHQQREDGSTGDA